MQYPTTLLITGAGPDSINRNAALRPLVAEGFRTVLGPGAVTDVPLEAAPRSIRALRPSFVLCFGSCMPDAAFLRPTARAAREVGGLCGVWLHDDPYEFDFRYRAVRCADIIFSNDSWATAHYEHDRAFHLPLAASPSRHYRPLGRRLLNDLYFCGVPFANRVAFLRALPPTGDLRYLIEGPDWPRDIPWAAPGRVDNGDLPDAYSRSLAVLNIGRHLDLANGHYCLTASTPGPRTFEAALAGTVQLFVAESLEILDSFAADSEILLVDSAAQVPDILRRLRADPDAARQIAAAAQERALREHCYWHRAARAVALIRTHLGLDLRVAAGGPRKSLPFPASSAAAAPILPSTLTRSPTP